MAMLVYQRVPIESRPFFSGSPCHPIYFTGFFRKPRASRDVTELMDLAQRADSTLRPRVDRRWGGLRRFSWVENLVTTVTTWLFPKNGGTPKMDGENNGKPY